MADTSLLDGGTKQNIKYAGCSDELIQSFVRIAEKERTKKHLKDPQPAQA